MVGISLVKGGTIETEAEYVTEDENFFYLKDADLQVNGKFKKEAVDGYYKVPEVNIFFDGDDDDDEYDF